jgi:hypothetical protein
MPRVRSLWAVSSPAGREFVPEFWTPRSELSMYFYSGHPAVDSWLGSVGASASDCESPSFFSRSGNRLSQRPRCGTLIAK